MPLIPKYNILINCKKCNAVFLKKKKTGNICQTCQRLARNECRSKNLYSHCRICGVQKELNQAIYCPECHNMKYRGKYVKKDKINQTLEDIRQLNEVVSRIKDTQRSFIYSLYDVNDIIEVWYKMYKGRTDCYELYSSGEQIQKMWFDLVKIKEEADGKD